VQGARSRLQESHRLVQPSYFAWLRIQACPRENPQVDLACILPLFVLILNGEEIDEKSEDFEETVL
jgi:hypothetical protein